jgi:hypothetical protein
MAVSTQAFRRSEREGERFWVGYAYY